MLESLLATYQALMRWLDERPAARMGLTLGLLAIAVLLPLPGWLLDGWVMASFLGAAGVALLVLAVGGEHSPEELLAGLPPYLTRFALHRLALALALTKAILAGSSPGLMVEWLAERGLGGSVGLGVAALAVVYLIRWSLSAPLASPGAGVVALARRHTGLALAAAASLLAAGVITGLAVRGWTLALTLQSLTLYGLAEALVSALPGLVVMLAVHQWLSEAHEEPEAKEARIAQAPEPVESEPAAGITVRVGAELFGTARRVLATQAQPLRERVTRNLGLTLPAIALERDPELAPRAFAVVVRGVPEQAGELEPGKPAETLIGAIEAAVRLRAADLALAQVEVTPRHLSHPGIAAAPLS